MKVRRGVGNGRASQQIEARQSEYQPQHCVMKHIIIDRHVKMPEERRTTLVIFANKPC